ncbi:hypothetical protein AB0I49_00935 [Streptomyces sp. NPDC050617]|uniref:hypothetical protein n=1 Tax=Streptomyces sp. NPDC050617 TaxID=3154628 RepID=UPI00342F7F44
MSEVTEALPADPLTERIADDMRGGLRVAGLVILGAVHFGLALPALLANLDHYRQPWIQFAAFGVLTLVMAADLLLGARGRARSRRWAAVGLGCALAASAVATSRLPAAYFLATPHWSFLEIGWFGVLLLYGERLRWTLLFIGGCVALTLAQLLAAGAPSRQVAAGMAVSSMVICAFQAAAAIMAGLLRGCAAAASATAREQERVRTEAEVSARIHADQRARYEDLRRSVLPLLAGLAGGELDPADERVRRRCAFEAARLRRLFAERDQAADPLVHELRACIGVAERNGVDVQLAVRGTPAPVPRALRRALTEPVLAALTTAEHTARATVVRGGGRVRVSVVTDAPRTDIPAASAGLGIQVRTVQSEGRLWVEAACAVPGGTNADTDAEGGNGTGGGGIGTGPEPPQSPVHPPPPPPHSSSSETHPS